MQYLSKLNVVKLVFVGIIALALFAGYKIYEYNRENLTYCVTHSTACTIWRLESQRDTLMQITPTELKQLDNLDKQ